MHTDCDVALSTSASYNDSLNVPVPVHLTAFFSYDTSYIVPAPKEHRQWKLEFHSKESPTPYLVKLSGHLPTEEEMMKVLTCTNFPVIMIPLFMAVCHTLQQPTNI